MCMLNLGVGLDFISFQLQNRLKYRFIKDFVPIFMVPVSFLVFPSLIEVVVFNLFMILSLLVIGAFFILIIMPL